MTDAKPRGDPFDGLIGLFALWIVLATWIEAVAGPPSWIANWAGSFVVDGRATPVLALDAYLIICGLMASRAARGGLNDATDLPRFIFWRALRFAPSLLVGAALFLATEAALSGAGLDSAMTYFTANELAAPLAAAFVGSVLIGVATVFGAISGAIGRAGLAAFAAACIAARVTPGMELTAVADGAARIAAAFTLGCFLDSVAASGRVARSIRRIKERSAGGVEFGALIALVASVVLTPAGLLPVAPFAITGYLLIFARRRGGVSDNFLCAPVFLELGRAATPMVGCCFIITWPVSHLARLEGGGAFSTAIALSPLFVLAAFGLAFAVRRLVEDPARDFGAGMRRRIAHARWKTAEESS